jgi:hypothetical protein
MWKMISLLIAKVFKSKKKPLIPENLALIRRLVIAFLTADDNVLEKKVEIHKTFSELEDVDSMEYILELFDITCFIRVISNQFALNIVRIKKNGGRYTYNGKEYLYDKKEYFDWYSNKFEAYKLLIKELEEIMWAKYHYEKGVRKSIMSPYTPLDYIKIKEDQELINKNTAKVLKSRLV